MAPPKQPFLLWRTEPDDLAELPRGPNPSDMPTSWRLPGMQERLHTLLPPNTVRAPTVQEVAAGGAPSPQTVRHIKDLAALTAAPVIGPAGLTAYMAARGDPGLQDYVNQTPAADDRPIKGLDLPQAGGPHAQATTAPADRYQLALRMVGGSGGPLGVRAPTIGNASLADAAVQGQLQDPRVRAMAAPDVGAIQFNPDDYTQAPEGEDALERFALREMMVLGDRAPKAVVANWLSIQDAKRQRVANRADYFAGLVKQRYMMDLQRRNQGDVIDATNARAALDRVTMVRNQEAALKMQASIANANLMESYQQRMSAENVAAMKAAMEGMNQKPMSVQQIKLYQEGSEKLTDLGDLALSASDLVNQAHDLEANGSWFVGAGTLGEWGAQVTNMFGNEQYQEFNMKVQQLFNAAVRAMAKDAGKRGIDTEPELKRLQATMPTIGTDPRVMDKWFQQVLALTYKRMETTAQAMNQIIPGDGDKRLRDMQEVLGASTKAQAAASTRLRNAGQNKDFSSVVNY